MRHIKIYEDYTDDELSDLIGDLRGVGHHKVDFDINFRDYPETEGDEKKMLFGELKAGEIVLVDVSDDTDTATFTFKGTAKSALPDSFEDLTDPASA